MLRRKIAERQAWNEATPEQPAEHLPLLFDLACKDADWIRLLEWEALRCGDQPVIEEAERRAAATLAVERIRRRQASRSSFKRVRPAPCVAGHRRTDDVSRGVPSTHAAHHGSESVRPGFSERTAGVFAKIRHGLLTGKIAIAMKQSFFKSRSFAGQAGFVVTVFVLAATGIFSSCSRSEKSAAKQGASGGGPPGTGARGEGG